MFFKQLNNFIVNDIFLLFIIFLFSFLINSHYASFGVFPIDTFLHFDSGFRVLNEEYPIKDYWIHKGIFVDYLEAFFFFLFGVSWKTHILHSSFINGLIAVGTFFVLRNLNLNKSYSLLYSLSFAILAYPVSGTPFVDHHAAFLCLFGIYCFILALNDKGNIYLILTPIFFGLSFISKQTPSAYIIIPFGVMIILYSILNKNFKFIAYPFLGSLIFLVTIALIGKIQGISFDDFLVQYIFHPQTIGSSRLDNINFSFSGLIGKYKFIYILLILLSYLNVKNLIANKKYAKDKNFYIYLSILFYSLGLVLHQILTKNQIFIYFILPLLFAFMTIYLKDITKKYKTTILLAIFFFSFF